MYIDRLQLFRGKPIKIDEDVFLHSPSVDDITEIGEATYYLYLRIATFDSDVLQYIFRDDIVSNSKYKSTYELFTSQGVLIQFLTQALSFFTKRKIEYHEIGKFFYIDECKILHSKNYEQFSTLLKEINGIWEEEQTKFKNNKAKELFEKMQKLKQKIKKKNDSLGLKDILSILCDAEGNGINIFNVGSLTIYQVYERYERLNLKENHRRILGVWSNGLLKEADQLPEWIVKSKL